jgi:hypothetical protein
MQAVSARKCARFSVTTFVFHSLGVPPLAIVSTCFSPSVECDSQRGLTPAEDSCRRHHDLAGRTDAHALFTSAEMWLSKGPSPSFLTVVRSLDSGSFLPFLFFFVPVRARGEQWRFFGRSLSKGSDSEKRVMPLEIQYETSISSTTSHSSTVRPVHGHSHLLSLNPHPVRMNDRWTLGTGIFDCYE